MYFVFAYSQADLRNNASWAGICMGSYEDLDDAKTRAEEFAYRDFCYILNGFSGGRVDMKPVDWDTRARIASKPEAMAIIASRLQALNEQGMSGDNFLMKEVEEFATKWNVPFSAEMHTLFMAKFSELDAMEDESEDDDDWDSSGCSWDSSSRTC